MTENYKDGAEAFNCYFCSVGENFSLDIVEHYDLRQYLPNVNYNLYENVDLATPAELMEILRHFDANSKGNDGVLEDFLEESFLTS